MSKKGSSKEYKIERLENEENKIKEADQILRELEMKERYIIA